MNVITLGIGTPGGIPYFVLLGLSPSGPVVVPDLRGYVSVSDAGVTALAIQDAGVTLLAISDIGDPNG